MCFNFGIVSFFTDISSEMLYPIIPIFLTAVLHAPMSVVGLIEGIAESTASLLKVISGWLSDKSGKRKPFVIYGYSLSTIAKPLLAFAATWHFVLAARFLDRFGKGLRSSARDALIADSTEAQYRGKAFGFHRALDTVGAVLGPLIALVLLYYLDRTTRDIDASYRTIFSIVYLGFAMANAGYMVWLLFAIYGFYIAMTDGVSKAYAVDLVPADKRGTAIGLYYTATGLMALISSIIAGLLWDMAGASAPFLFGSATALVATVMLVVLMPKKTIS